MEIRIRLHFERYVSDPYWPATARLIDVLKISGASRLRSEAARDRALAQYLRAQGMSLQDFRALEAQAAEPFYRDQAGEIIVPRLHVDAALAQGAATCSSSIRVCRPEQSRVTFWSSDLATGRREASGVWERFAVVKSGSGATLSNQRALRSNHYLADFDAEGVLTCALEAGQARKVRDFLAYVGSDVGIGASRKMGAGRFTVDAFEPEANVPGLQEPTLDLEVPEPRLAAPGMSPEPVLPLEA